MNQVKQQKLLKFVFLLSIFGIIVSGYLTYDYYSTLNSVCDINETFQCSSVSESEYSELLGIPVAMLGLFGYSFLSFISFGLYSNNSLLGKIKKNAQIKKIISARTLFFFSAMALLFSLYLTYAEFFLIKALCVFCLMSQAIILTIAIISYQNNNQNNKLNVKKMEED